MLELVWALPGNVALLVGDKLVNTMSNFFAKALFGHFFSGFCLGFYCWVFKFGPFLQSLPQVPVEGGNHVNFLLFLHKGSSGVGLFNFLASCDFWLSNGSLKWGWGSSGLFWVHSRASLKLEMWITLSSSLCMLIICLATILNLNDSIKGL